MSETISPNVPIDFRFYLLPNFSMLAFSAAIEALSLANRVLGYNAYEWRAISREGGPVRASCGFDIQTSGDLLSERKQQLDRIPSATIFICADKNVDEYTDKSLAAWLRECKMRGLRIGALGTGTYILALAGLLENKHCTIHWERLPSFVEQFSAAKPNHGIYEVDGQIVTCAGGMASFDMIINIIEQDFGERIAAQICEIAIVERVRTGDERQRIPLLQRHGIKNATVIAAIDIMENSLTDPISTEEIASRLKRSRRQVERLFRHEIKRSPIQYYRELRVERAKQLLSHCGLPIVEIAISCGFVSASHFSRCYRKVYGMSPQEARNSPNSSVW